MIDIKRTCEKFIEKYKDKGFLLVDENVKDNVGAMTLATQITKNYEREIIIIMDTSLAVGKQFIDTNMKLNTIFLPVLEEMLKLIVYMEVSHE